MRERGDASIVASVAEYPITNVAELGSSQTHPTVILGLDPRTHELSSNEPECPALLKCGSSGQARG
ncbi:hypothetical protein SAMN05443582_1021124 [Phyllobacterium sp. OV277]|nr:hypothetical protein SAMN05443582_1021124 [Phyllobacterium sp. OV277]